MNGAKLGEGSTQYKCSDCGSSVTTIQSSVLWQQVISEGSINTSEIDSKITELKGNIVSVQSEITALETENADLLKKIQSASVEDAAIYRQT